MLQLLASRSLVSVLALVMFPGAAGDVLAGVIEVPGEVATVQGAVDMATGGDVVLLAAGDYPEIVVIDGRSVSLVADGPGAGLDGLLIRDVPAGEPIVLRNLDIAPPPLNPFVPPTATEAVRLKNNAAAIHIEACTLSGGHGFVSDFDTGLEGLPGQPALWAQNCASVVVTSSELCGGDGGTLFDSSSDGSPTTGGTALYLLGSQVAVYDSLLQGGHGGSVDAGDDAGAAPGGHGAWNRTNGRLELHGSEARGGHGGSADCSFSSCGLGGAGGDGVRQDGTMSRVVERAATLLPGVGGVHGEFGKGSAPSGLDLRLLGGTSTTYPAAYRHLALSSPVREGEDVQLALAGEPGDGVLLFLAVESAHLPLGLRQGTFHLGAPLLLTGLPVGPLPPSGTLAAPLPVPDLGPGVEHLSLRMQAAFTAGGQTLLGPPSVTTLLDP